VGALVVVDNGSSDGTREWLAEQESKHLHPVLLKENQGGAGGFATGLAYVRDNFDPDWVLLMDDDARPLPGAISAFNAIDLHACDAVVAAVFLPDGSISDMNRPLRNPFLLNRNWRRPYRLSNEDFAPDAAFQEVDMATFVGFFLSRRALHALDGPDPRLFIYGDDLIHSLQLRQTGMRIVFAPSVRFEHDCNTLHGEANCYHPTWKVYYHYRNAILLYRLAAGWLVWPIVALRLPKWWMAARHYGPEAEEFRRLLRAALADGLRSRLDSPPKHIPRPPEQT